MMNNFPYFEQLNNLAKSENKQIYLIGGFLRDFHLGTIKKDFDFALQDNALDFAKKFSSNIFGAYVVLDEKRGCARVVKKIDGNIFTFDFADFRDKTLVGDLNKRDFTVNTLYVKLSDLVNESFQIEKVLADKLDGIKDLKAKKIKMTNDGVFKDDPLRMLRAYSLQAINDFRIEKETKVQIKKDRDLIINTSYERITVELFKILESCNTYKVIKDMTSIGLLERIIPQIKIMFDCQQGDYHHLDVWEHSLETLKQLEILVKDIKDQQVISFLKEKISGDQSRLALMKLGALLHDIGKPQTKMQKLNKFSFHGHENAGKSIVKCIAKMLKLSSRQRHILEDLVYFHLRPGYLSNFKRPTEKAIYRFLRDSSGEAIGIALLSLADQRSTRGKLTTDADQIHHEKICFELIEKQLHLFNKKPVRKLLDGNDIIKHFKLKPSKIVGMMISEIDEKQALGKIKTKKEAFECADKVLEAYKYK